MDFCKNNGNADPEALKKDQLHCGMVLCDQIVLLRGVRLYNCAACLHCYISKFCVCDSFFSSIPSHFSSESCTERMG